MIKEKFYRRAGLLILLVTAYDGLNAQIPFSMDLAKANQYKTSPNSEVLGKNVEASVSMFHGMPSVQIPLYSLKGNNLTYNMALSYYTGGIKVNEKPTWVGLGWNLEGDAQIVRKANHVHDEQYLTSFYPFGSGAIRPEQGYYFTSSQLNTANWLSTNFLDDAVNTMLANNASTLNRVVLDGEPDEFMFSFAGYSGSFYRTEKGSWAVKSKQNIDIKIEEALHTVGVNQTVGYKFKADPNSTDPYYDQNVASLFTKFTLTTSDGFKYVFGGNENAIEFTKTPIPYPGNVPNYQYPKYHNEYFTANAWKLTKILAPDGEEINFSYERGRLLYERDRSYAQGVRYHGAGNNPFPAKLHYNLSASFPVYLKSIETQSSVLSFIRSASVEVNYKRLRILQFGNDIYPYSLSAGAIDNLGTLADREHYLARTIWGVGIGLNYAQTLAGSSDNHFRQFTQQLDSIKLFDKSSQQYVNGFKLVHSADANTRRTLNEVYQYNFKNSEQTGRYVFQYDDVAGMKPYESVGRDAWGYLADNQDELQVQGNYGMVDIPELSFSGAAFPNYFSAFSTKGMLKKIINPLGGSTEFVYEPNTYSSKVKANLGSSMMDLENLGGNTYGSGSRVAKIIKKDYFGAPDQVTRYDYSLNYPDIGVSSGILNADLIFDELTAYNCANNNSELIIFEYGTDMFNEQINKFKGGIVNYSQVTEIRPDGSYTTNKYSNNDDPQYRDELHAGYSNIKIASQKDFRLSALDLERGNLLNSRMFSNNHKLVKETINTYNTDPNRKANFIKAMAHKTTLSGGLHFAPSGVGCNGGGTSLKKRLWAYKIYTYKNPLIKTVEKTYQEDGTVAFVQEKNFNYDAYGNLVLETENTSEGKVLSKATKFNSHPDYSAMTVSGSEALGLKLLNTLGIKNYPVEQLVYTDQQPALPNTNGLSRILTGTEFVYKSNQPVLDKEYALELNAPIEGMHSATNTNGLKSSKINASGAWEQDSRFIVQKSYPVYTAQLFANKPKTILDKAGNEAIIWDYAGKYPVATFQNTTSDQVAYTGFEGNYNGANSEFKNGWQFNGTNFQGSAAKIGRGAIFVTPSTTKTLSDVFISSTIALQNGKKYRLCFWAPTVNNYEYYRAYNGNITQVQPLKTGANGLGYFELEFTASGSGSIGLICHRAPTGSGPAYLAAIDEIALFPVGSVFKSASYDAATGQILSINDGAGHLQLFEYDVFNRLIKVKDENEHLITDHEYKIQSPY